MSQALLRRALEKAGTGRALAAALDKSEQRISNWKHGKEQIPDDGIAGLAAYVGTDPIQALAEERGGTWARVAQALKDRVSAGFDLLLLYANRRKFAPLR